MNNFRLALRTSALFAVTFLFVSVISGPGDSEHGYRGSAMTSTRVVVTRSLQNFCRRDRKDEHGRRDYCDGSRQLWPLIIRKSITIDGTAIPSSILAAQATGITIDIPFRRQGDTKRAVRIRGLSINGLGNGIQRDSM